MSSTLNMEVRNRASGSTVDSSNRYIKPSTPTGTDNDPADRAHLLGPATEKADITGNDHDSNAWKALLLVIIIFLLFLVSTSSTYYNKSSDPSGLFGDGSGTYDELNVATWNIAAINNNPFEYWITYDNEVYKRVMSGVQKFVNNPLKKDVRVDSVFTAKMFKELLQEMKAKGWVGVDETQEKWTKDFKNRLIISQFMKDNLLGLKRLASMPDRVTNTITDTADGSVLYRPTVINCYQDQFKSMDDWWKQWKQFMFHTVVKSEKTPSDMLRKIPKAKYDAITVEEERISIPLSTMAAAIFDSILVHMMMDIAPQQWQKLRSDMCHALNLKKNEKTLEILETQYQDYDVLFLQEVAASFIKTARESEVLQSRFFIVSPMKESKSNQNSVILINKAKFDISELTDVSAELQFSDPKMVADGDILAITTTNMLLASFHGDTNGMATIPVVSAVSDLLKTSYPGKALLFGLDANTYEHAKPGKTQDVLEFAQKYVSLGLTSCWGDKPDPTNHTTYNARTFLQPQLNKAAKKTEFLKKGDVNPKDFILFNKGVYRASRVTKDNTGKKHFIENHVFPTLEFPSDHGILSATIVKATNLK